MRLRHCELRKKYTFCVGEERRCRRCSIRGHARSVSVFFCHAAAAAATFWRSRAVSTSAHQASAAHTPPFRWRARLPPPSATACTFHRRSAVGASRWRWSRRLRRDAEAPDPSVFPRNIAAQISPDDDVCGPIMIATGTSFASQAVRWWGAPRRRWRTASASDIVNHAGSPASGGVPVSV